MAETHQEIVKVWIEPGCIVCDACETDSPEVFEVLEETCIVRPEAANAEFAQARTPSIIEAAEGCPVDVIKFEMVEVEGPEPWEAEEEAVEHHEKLGHNGWMWMLIPAGLMGLTFVPGKRVRIAAASGGLAASLGVAGWVALTAHAGGELVYVQGLGVPDRGSSDPERSRPERDDDSDD